MISSNTALDTIQISLEIMASLGVISIKKIYRSNGQESLYIRSYNSDEGKLPLNYSRVSNHNTKIETLIKDKHKHHKANNIGIEFTEQRFKKNGTEIPPLDDKDPSINQVVPKNGRTIRPYLFTVFRYDPKKLESEDIKVICKALVVFIQTGVYNDPFKNTPKAADIIPRYSEIIPNTREDYLKGRIPDEKPSENEPQELDESYTCFRSYVTPIYESHFNTTREYIRSLITFDDNDVSAGYINVSNEYRKVDYVQELIGMCCRYGRYTEGEDEDDEIWYIPLKDKLKPFEEPLMVSNTSKIDGRIEWHRNEENLYVEVFDFTTKYDQYLICVDELDEEIQERLVEWAREYCDSGYL